MAQTIKLKRSATSGAAPGTSDLALGEVAINTYDGKMYIKKSVSGAESIVEVGSGTTVFQYADAGMVEYEYTATANQTTFSGTDTNSATLSYTANSVLVFLNGVLQDDGTDYTATNGTSVVFTNALAANDEVRIISISSSASVHNPTKLDAITTVNGQAAYTMNVNSAGYTPSHQNALIVSVNGITQEPGDSFTISGTTITFSPALVTGDVIDYIVDMGRKMFIPSWEGNLEVTGNILPGADSTYDLGASGTEWANVYADTVTANLTGNVTGTVSSLSNHDTDDLSEGSTNLYYTDTRVDSRLSSGSVATIETSGNVTVGGNLTVNGTTTTVNTTTLDVEDKNITLNYSTGDSSSTADGAGITVQDAVNSSTDATLLWNASDDAWNFSHTTKIAGSVIATVDDATALAIALG